MMLLQNSGPHVVEHLKGRVESLTNALERAQDRINDLERVFGTQDDIMPLITLGLTPTQARIVHVLRSRGTATGEQIQFAMYADNPDQLNELDARGVMKTQCCHLKKKLARLGIQFESIGYGKGSSGYRMSGPNKARLARLISSGARLVTRGRLDRKDHRRAAE